MVVSRIREDLDMNKVIRCKRCSNDFKPKSTTRKVCQDCLFDIKEIQLANNRIKNRKVKNENKFKASFEAELEKYPAIFDTADKLLKNG